MRHRICGVAIAMETAKADSANPHEHVAWHCRTVTQGRFAEPAAATPHKPARYGIERIEAEDGCARGDPFFGLRLY